MRISSNFRRIAGWIAALAVLLATVATVWTRALSALVGDGTEWVEVCTVQGTQWVAATTDAAPGAPDDGSAQRTKHCPLCLFHANLAGLPPAGVEFLTAAAGRPDAASGLVPAPAHAAWPGSQSRAPPTIT